MHETDSGHRIRRCGDGQARDDHRGLESFVSNVFGIQTRRRCDEPSAKGQRDFREQKYLINPINQCHVEMVIDPRDADRQK